MVSLGRGICVLPEWMADNYMKNLELNKYTIGEKGIRKKLFVALRKQDINISYIKKFILVGEQTANKTFERAN